MSEIQLVREPMPPHEALGALWRGLERQGGASFFTSWIWIGTWLRCLPEHLRPSLLVARRGGEEIAAAILVPCLERRRGLLNVRQLHLNATGDAAFDCITIEHNGFVGGERARMWSALVGWFAHEGEADELIVPGLVEAQPAPSPRNLLHRQTPSRGFACDLPQGGMGALLAVLSRNTRQQLRRNLRGWEAFGALRIERAASAETALAWFGEMKRLHIGYWTGRERQHAFHHPFWETFHRALIAEGLPEGSVRMRCISAGPQVLGYLYDFRREGHVYAYQSGFDDALANLRPGYVSHLLAMEQDARDGAHTYDFLAGDNQLKRSLGTKRYAIDSHRIGKRHPGLRLESAAMSLRDRLRF